MKYLKFENEHADTPVNISYAGSTPCIVAVYRCKRDTIMNRLVQYISLLLASCLFSIATVSAVVPGTQVRTNMTPVQAFTASKAGAFNNRFLAKRPVRVRISDGIRLVAVLLAPESRAIRPEKRPGVKTTHVQRPEYKQRAGVDSISRLPKKNSTAHPDKKRLLKKHARIIPTGAIRIGGINYIARKSVGRHPPDRSSQYGSNHIVIAGINYIAGRPTGRRPSLRSNQDEPNRIVIADINYIARKGPAGRDVPAYRPASEPETIRITNMNYIARKHQ